MNKLRLLAAPKDIGLGLPSTPGKGKPMTLRNKTRLLFGIALIGLMGVVYATCSSILLSSVVKAEEQDTRQIIKGVLGVFAQTQEDFSSRFRDWSAWDDTYAFIEDRNKHYIESGLATEVLTSANINLVLYIHSSGSIVFGTSTLR